MNKAIADIRKDYKLKALLEDDVQADAIDQFSVWWDEAIKSDIDEVNAMTLATVSSGKPSARIVLLKGYTKDGFIFFTNYLSNKGKALAENPNATLLFFWKELERQVRIEGVVEKITSTDSDAYFTSRPVGSKVGAWASVQSSVIPNRQAIEESYLNYLSKYKEGDVPRPPHWGGYIVIPGKLEFWQGRSSRLHDRLLYTRHNETWKIDRLSP